MYLLTALACFTNLIIIKILYCTDTVNVIYMMVQMLDHVGTVNSLMENGDLLVRYPNNSLLPVNPQAAKKVYTILIYIQCTCQGTFY